MTTKEAPVSEAKKLNPQVERAVAQFCGKAENMKTARAKADAMLHERADEILERLPAYQRWLGLESGLKRAEHEYMLAKQSLSAVEEELVAAYAGGQESTPVKHKFMQITSDIAALRVVIKRLATELLNEVRGQGRVWQEYKHALNQKQKVLQKEIEGQWQNLLLEIEKDVERKLHGGGGGFAKTEEVLLGAIEARADEITLTATLSDELFPRRPALYPDQPLIPSLLTRIADSLTLESSRIQPEGYVPGYGATKGKFVIVGLDPEIARELELATE